VSTATAESADNVIDHGGTGSDNASIWLVVWGPRTVHGIVPKGSKAGLQVKDLGEQMIQNSDGSKWQAYVTHYRFDAGLTVRDWRYVVARLQHRHLRPRDDREHEEPDHVDDQGDGAHPEPRRRPRGVLHEPRRPRVAAHRHLEKIGNNLSWETVAGKRVIMFDNIPVRRCDALLNTEARVV
jgi:hypothetical protein